MVSATAKQRGFQASTLQGGLLQGLDMSPWMIAGWLIVAGCSFMNLANFLVDKEEVGLDPQVLLKLGLIGLGGLYGLHGLLTRPRVREMLASFPLAWILLLTGFYFLAVPFSPFPRNALVSSCSIVAVLLMTVTALDDLGIMRTVYAMFCGLSLFVFGSWIVYFAIPEIGVLEEPIANGEFASRMSGLAHANTLGQFSGLTVVLAIVLTSTYKKGNVVILIIGLLACASLINSFSRTSLMACVVSLMVAYRHVFLKREFLTAYFVAAVIGLVGLMLVSTQVDLQEKATDKLALLSKSDDAEELATATGRSVIWAHAIELIQKEPLTGYGAATQKYYFEYHSLYTHNMILNVTFSAGIFAGLAAILMLLGRLRALFYQRHPLVDSITVFIVVNGLFENVIFSILAGLPTMLLILVLSWPLLHDDPATDTATGHDGPAANTIHRRYLRLEAP